MVPAKMVGLSASPKLLSSSGIFSPYIQWSKETIVHVQSSKSWIMGGVFQAYDVLGFSIVKNEP